MSLDLMQLSGKGLRIHTYQTNFNGIGNVLKLGQRVGYGTSQITYLVGGMSDIVFKILDEKTQEIFLKYDIERIKQILDDLVGLGIPFPKIYGVIQGTIDNKVVIAFIQSYLDIYIEDGFSTSKLPGLSSTQNADKIIQGLFQLTNGSITFGDWIPYINAKFKTT